MYLIAKVAVAGAVISIDKAYDYLVPPSLEEEAQRGRRVTAPFGRGNQLTDGFILETEQREEKPRGVKALAHIFGPEAALDEEGLSLAGTLRRRYFCTFFEAANLMMPPGIWSRRTYYRLAPGLTVEEACARWENDWDAQAVCQTLGDKGEAVAEEVLKKSLSATALKRVCKALLQDHTMEKTVRFDGCPRDQTIRILRLAMPLSQAVAALRRGKGYEKRVEALECIAGFQGIPEKEVCYLTGIPQSALRRMEQNGLLSCRMEETFRRVTVSQGEEATPLCLEPEQQKVCEGIQAMGLQQPGAALLQGVTGSGKTQVYIKLIQWALEQGRTAMVLVPEISLTPQLLRRFCAYFKEDVAVFHSGLTPGQRYDEYKRVKTGKARVVLGTRSAVFAPLNNIGLIILDEEQEWTYKSDVTPRYHAREVAKYRCVHHKALLLLGSATPAMESRFLAEEGKYRFFRLDHRYRNTPLPRVIVDDLRQQLREGEPDIIGRALQKELEHNLQKGEQSVLFLNRRGNSRLVTCVSCGYIPQCENCSVALTYHSKNGRLMCHHCGYSQPMPEKCPQCGEEHLRLVGFGTQKVQQELESKFPGIRIIRMDADTTVQRTSHETLLDAFGRGEAQVLLGTQMIAKGLDFDNVTLVGVLDADLSLYSGDYRAGERTFSLLTQVIGRAGRREREGRAVIQTYTPKNPVILAAAAQDYDGFYEYEINVRQALLAPPFAHVISFLLSGETQERTLRASQRLAATLEGCFEGPYAVLRAPVLGPAPPAIQVLNRKYRYQVSFRGKDDAITRRLVMDLLRAFYGDSANRGITLVADIDPYSL